MRNNTPVAPAGQTISVSLIRLGHTPMMLTLAQDTTLATALVQANVSLSMSEKVYVGGQEVTHSNFGAAILDDGDSIAIVGAKDGGNR